MDIHTMPILFDLLPFFSLNILRCGNALYTVTLRNFFSVY